MYKWPMIQHDVCVRYFTEHVPIIEGEGEKDVVWGGEEVSWQRAVAALHKDLAAGVECEREHARKSERESMACVGGGARQETRKGGVSFADDCDSAHDSHALECASSLLPVSLPSANDGRGGATGGTGQRDGGGPTSLEVDKEGGESANAGRGSHGDSSAPSERFYMSL